ncbi:MAG: hypothetical protein PHN42_01720 [Bacilli bacterium]|nr:hypothetical protein [Bacilli bacterium]
MLFLVVLVMFALIIIFDYNKIKIKQSKKQNIIYILLTLSSFLLLISYVFNFKIPIISHVLRKIINK